MAFDVFENATPSRATVPYFLNVQNDLLQSFATRIIVPLSLAKPSLSRFDMSIEAVVEDEVYYCLVPQLTAVTVESLGRHVTSLLALEYEIKRAIDRMLGGW